MLMLILVKGGADAIGWRWAFVATGTLWLATAVTKGMRAKPGPKLAGPLRTYFKPLHWGMYALVAVCTVLNLTALLHLTPNAWAWTSLIVLFGTSSLHAILHLWRHTTLNDGALRMMTPRFTHKHL